MPGPEDFAPQEVERGMVAGYDEREDRRFFGETAEESLHRIRQPIFPITGGDIGSFVAGVDQAIPSMGVGLGRFINDVRAHFAAPPPVPGEADDTDEPSPEKTAVGRVVDTAADLPLVGPVVQAAARGARGFMQAASPGSFPDTPTPDEAIAAQSSPEVAAVGRELGIWAPLGVAGGGVGLAGARALGQAVINTPRLGAAYLRMASVFDTMGAAAGSSTGDAITGTIFANPDDPSLIVILAGLESDNPFWEGIREGMVESLLADEDADAFERRIANGVQEGMVTLGAELAGAGVVLGLRSFYRAVRNGTNDPTGSASAHLRRIAGEGRDRFNALPVDAPDEDREMARAMIEAGTLADVIDQARRTRGGGN